MAVVRTSIVLFVCSIFACYQTATNPNQSPRHFEVPVMLCHLTEESHDSVTWLELVMFVMLKGVKLSCLQWCRTCKNLVFSRVSLPIFTVSQNVIVPALMVFWRHDANFISYWQFHSFFDSLIHLFIHSLIHWWIFKLYHSQRGS